MTWPVTPTQPGMGHVRVETTTTTKPNNISTSKKTLSHWFQRNKVHNKPTMSTERINLTKCQPTAFCWIQYEWEKKEDGVQWTTILKEFAWIFLSFSNINQIWTVALFCGLEDVGSVLSSSSPAHVASMHMGASFSQGPWKQVFLLGEMVIWAMAVFVWRPCNSCKKGSC